MLYLFLAIAVVVTLPWMYYKQQWQTAADTLQLSRDENIQKQAKAHDVDQILIEHVAESLRIRSSLLWIKAPTWLLTMWYAAAYCFAAEATDPLLPALVIAGLIAYMWTPSGDLDTSVRWRKQLHVFFWAEALDQVQKQIDKIVKEMQQLRDQAGDDPSEQTITEATSQAIQLMQLSQLRSMAVTQLTNFGVKMEKVTED